MYLKQEKWITILRCIISCVLFVIATMCFTYMLMNTETIQWFWLALCISGGVLGYAIALINVITLWGV